MVGTCGMDGGGGGEYMVLVVKPEGRRPLERPRHTWEDIKLDLLEIGWVGGMDWIYLAEDKDMWAEEPDAPEPTAKGEIQMQYSSG